MNSQMLKAVLQRIGLDPAEAKVYLACLQLGTQDVQVIADEVRLSPRDTAAILTGLVEKGFVAQFSGGQDFFTAQQPDVIMHLLEAEEELMKEHITELHDALPMFTSMMNPAFTKPEMNFYEGEKGLIAAYEDTLTATSDILTIASIDDIEHVLPKYVPKYRKRRKAAGILAKAIFTDTPLSRKLQQIDDEELRITKLIAPELMDFQHMEWKIYDDKVAYFSSQEMFSLIVKSPVIANGMRNVFNLCWKIADIAETLPPSEAA